MGMKTLIDDIYTIIDGQLSTPTLSARSVWKGFRESPEMIPQTEYPYISIEDGGERVEEVEANKSQNHFYSVLFEMGVWEYNTEDAFNNILDLSDQLKAILELEANRKLDGHVWAVSIVTFAWLKEEQEFMRARQIQVDYFELETKFFTY